MARKWSNRNLPGALHFVTGNVCNRIPVFKQIGCCHAFFDVCAELKASWPFKLIAYVLMPDHFHLIVNPRDGNIRRLTGAMKSLAARRIVAVAQYVSFLRDQPDADGSTHQVWQESFKDFPLWSEWLIWQKINYIHANPISAKLVKSTREYRWSSFGSFYFGESEPVLVDKEWWWPDDVQKLAKAAAEWSKEKASAKNKPGGGKPPFQT